MAFNTGMISGKLGIMRFVVLILLIVSFSLAVNAYAPTSSEHYFLSITMIIFILSTIWIILSVVGVIDLTGKSNKLDAGFQLIGGILVAIGALVWLISVGEVGNNCRYDKEQMGSCPVSLLAKRILAGIFGLTAGGLGVFLGFTIYRS